MARIVSAMSGTLGAVWGVAGVAVLLGSAIYRLTSIGLEAFSYPLTWKHWLLLGIWVVLMLWSEAYRGFHKAFCPRVAARAKYLRDHPRPLHVVLAPLFCIGYFHATRRRQMATISLTLGIVVLIVIVGHLSQPWRGIIDIGVVVGLVSGLVSLGLFVRQAFGSETFSHSPEVRMNGR